MVKKEWKHVIPDSLKSILRVEENSSKIESAVIRTHKVAIFARESISLAMLQDIEAGVNDLLPLGQLGKVSSMFNSVVQGDRIKLDDNHKVFTRVRDAFKEIHGDDADSLLVDGRGLSQVIQMEAQRYMNDIKTMLCKQYRRRVWRYCSFKMWIPPDEFKRLSRDARRQHYERVNLVCTRVCCPGWQKLDLDDNEHAREDRAFVRSTRRLLRLDTATWSRSNLKRR